ncbi:MAG TPA: hypothetical protein VER11_27715, partial [Polyangiaceae bacterium]|nr:hypothetical protein [Polyangiaceae bacterium]
GPYRSHAIRAPSVDRGLDLRRQKWSDTAHRTLEAQLAKVILAVEDAAEGQVAAMAEAEEHAIRERSAAPA